MSKLRLLFPLLAAAFLSTTSAFAENASVSPELRFLMSYRPTASSRAADNEIESEPASSYIPVVIRVSSPGQQLPDFATELHRRGNIVLATVPVERLSELTGAQGVRRLESRACTLPAMNHARTFCSLEKAVASQPGATALDGTGVVVGFCDTGFDPGHPNFLHADGSPRTVKLVNYLLESATPEILDTPSDISQWTTDNPSEFHATHVAGILAGSFDDDGMQGVAPGAEIVATTSPLYDTYLLDGCEQVIDYAKSHDKPAAVNISISSTTGPHDGTTLFNQYMEMLADDATICISAGNDATRSGHVSLATTDQAPALRTYFRQYPELVLTHLAGTVDIWSSSSEPLKLRLLTQEAFGDHTLGTIELPIDPANGITECVACSDDYDESFGSLPLVALPSELYGYIHVTCEVNPENNRFNATLTCAYRDRTAQTNEESHYLLGIEAQPATTGTTVEAFSTSSIYFTCHDDRTPGCVNPEYRQTVNDFIFGNGPVGVGSMNSGNSFTLLNGSTLDLTERLPLGDVSYFSSYGNMPDGTPLPTVCAPGARIVSSISSYYTGEYPEFGHTTATISHTLNGREYYWAPAQGTSMSSPFTAGTVALWLQANPQLNGKDIINIIHDTADTPAVNPQNPQWGGGMLNAYTGLQQARALSGIGSVATDTPDQSSSVAVRVNGSTITVSHPLLPLTSVCLLRPDGTLALTSPLTQASSTLCSASPSSDGSPRWPTPGTPLAYPAADVSLDCSTLSPGLYIVVATDVSGHTHSTKALLR